MTQRGKLKKVERDRSLPQKVEEQLKEAIIQNVYTANDRLPSETELEQLFGVSRTVVREAIRMLAGQGLVEIRGRYGVFVSEIGMSQVVTPFASLMMQKCGDQSWLYLNQVRCLVEPEIARMAALKRSEEDVHYFEANLGEMKTNRDRPEELIAIDFKFHKKLALASGNPITPIIMEPVFMLLPKFISVNFKISGASDTSIEQHEKIIDCIKAKDSEGAYRAMAEHMKTAEKHVLMYYKSNGGKKT